jgi:CHAT domain-containing protein/tetratricopeptide (TPR) repeat protein
MVRFALSSAGWLCTIGLLTTAIPVLALPEESIAQSTQPDPATVEQLLTIGKAQVEQKDFEGAIGTYRKVLAVAESAHNLPLQLQALYVIGEAYRIKGQNAWKDKSKAIPFFEQSLEAFQKALEIVRRIPDRQSEADLLSAIGLSYDIQGSAHYAAGHGPEKSLTLHKQGLESLQQALIIAKDLKNTQLVKTILPSVSRIHSSMAEVYGEVKQYDAALEQTRLMYTIAKESGDPEDQRRAAKTERIVYFSLDDFYNTPEQYDRYIEVNQKIIALSRQLNDPEAQTLPYSLNIANVYQFRGQYAEALTIYQQVLARARANDATNSEFFALSNIGHIYREQAKYPEALAMQKQALQLTRTQQDVRHHENEALGNIAGVYEAQGQYEQALANSQQSLSITQKSYERYAKGMTPENIQEHCANSEKLVASDEKISEDKLGDDVCDHPDHPILGSRFNQVKNVIDGFAKVHRRSTAMLLNNIARIYSDQGNYRKASEYNEKALAIARELKNASDEATSFNNIASDSSTLGNYDKAHKFLAESLKVHMAQGNRVGELSSRTNIGRIFREQGSYSQALEMYQQALILSQTMKMRSREANILSQIGAVYQAQGNYASASEGYEKALTIQKQIGDPANIIETKLRVGNLQRQLGQSPKALTIHQEALALAQKIGAKQQEAKALLAIATDHREQGQLDDALKVYNQALEIATSIDDLNAKPQALYGIGQLYAQQNQPEKALTSLNAALAIQQRTGVKPRQAETLSAIGQVQTQLGKYAEAQTTLQRAYVLAQTVGDRATEATALANLGQLADRQKQPEIAILFYKQSVNTYESIRQNLLSLAQDQQKSYAETVADTYRTLAQLLISQKRFPEAQAVLELLKLRELKDYTRASIQPIGIQSPGISLGKTETAALNEILTKFKSLSDFSQKIDQCQPEKCGELLKLRDQNNTEILAAISKQRTILAQAYATQTTLKPDQLDQLAAPIVNAQPGTVLIYPIVFKDKIQFLLAFKAGDGAFTYRPFEQKVDSKDLYDTVVRYREQLKNPGNLNALKTTSQKLYNWLIKPLEAELNQPNIKHIVLAPDSVTRYIPFATLYDGQKYLIQRYSLSTVNAATTTNVTEKFPRPQANSPFLLAMGASTFPQSSPRLSDLNSVPAELSAIVKSTTVTTNTPSKGIYPGAQFLNQTFNYTALQDNLKNYQILHIATHGKADVGRSENSFIVAGNSSPITLDQIRSLRSYGLNKIHLVVLSACETAVGGNDADGMEMAGLSQAFLGNDAAKSVLASLWSVDDDSTALSMMQFYQHLAQGNITKAEALQQVQTDFINQKFTPAQAKAMLRYTITLSTPTQSSMTTRATDRSQENNYSHPYYWAPFVLIGNSL